VHLITTPFGVAELHFRNSQQMWGGTVRKTPIHVQFRKALELFRPGWCRVKPPRGSLGGGGARVLRGGRRTQGEAEPTEQRRYAECGGQSAGREDRIGFRGFCKVYSVIQCIGTVCCEHDVQMVAHVARFARSSTLPVWDEVASARRVKAHRFAPSTTPPQF